MIVIAVLFLILLFSLVWFLGRVQPTPTAVVVKQESPTVQTSRGQVEETPVEVVQREAETKNIDVALQSLAITFTERYGSYSTESSFANLYDVMDIMTVSFRDETQAFITSSKASSPYYGVTTRVLSVNIVSSDETSAVVKVATQREESKGSVQNSEIKYQDLLLTCVEEDSVWKVSSAIWQ